MELVELEGRKSRGRRKIQIKRIEKENARLLKFTKRTSFYRKASELATLSATAKPFLFGHPSVEAVLERYINYVIPKEPLNDGGVQPVVEDHQRKTTEELSEELDATLSQLKAEKKCGKQLRELIKASRAANPSRGNMGWWEAKIEELSIEQLDAISITMDAFFNDVANHFNQLENH